MKQQAAKATTYRIDPAIKGGLVKLAKILNTPQNQLVNDALREFVAERSADLMADLAATVTELNKLQEEDPGFAKAIKKAAAAEAEMDYDPAEGQLIDNSDPSSTIVRSILHE